MYPHLCMFRYIAIGPFGNPMAFFHTFLPLLCSKNPTANNSSTSNAMASSSRPNSSRQTNSSIKLPKISLAGGGGKTTLPIFDRRSVAIGARREKHWGGSGSGGLSGVGEFGSPALFNRRSLATLVPGSVGAAGDSMLRYVRSSTASSGAETPAGGSISGASTLGGSVQPVLLNVGGDRQASRLGIATRVKDMRPSGGAEASPKSGEEAAQFQPIVLDEEGRSLAMQVWGSHEAEFVPLHTI